VVTFLFSGIVYGASAGISPGPLLALVIRESLAGGWRAGLRAALAPLITDLPIVVLSLILLSRLPSRTVFPGIIALAGALFLIYLGVETIRSATHEATSTEVSRRSLSKAIVTNILSPHPYMFWLLVGAPTTLRAAEERLAYAAAFIIGFYLLLIGSKITVALLAGKSKQILTSRGYLVIMRTLGVALFVFAGILVRDGIRYLL
jgi:threonine/homoserine/homoserine lactone efflux protein